MHFTPASIRQQQRRVMSHRTNSNVYSFFNLLTSDELLGSVDALSPSVFRERLYPPTETLSMFLAQAMNADRSCQNIVNQTAIQRVTGGLSPISSHTGGYCRARERLPLPMVAGLTLEVAYLMDQEIPVDWRWQGRRVRIVDGTTATMPDTDSNQARFPQQGAQLPGLGFPICRVVGITCLASGALLNAAIGHFNGKGGDERTLLRSIQHTFEPGDLVLGDAFFSSYFFFADMLAKGVDVLMEQNGARKRVTDFRCGRRLGQKDHLVVWHKPPQRPSWMSDEAYAEAPKTLTLREFKAGGKIMITSLLSVKEAPKPKLKALYKSRWHVELDIRNIKDTLGMNFLSCRSPDMVEKEIWVYLLAYNLVRLLMAQSALWMDIAPRQLSFKHCLQLWSVSVQYMNLSNDEELTILFLLMAQQRVGNRPGRIEPRAVKRRPKPLALLTKPRALAREQIRKDGHPKRLK